MKLALWEYLCYFSAMLGLFALGLRSNQH